MFVGDGKSVLPLKNKITKQIWYETSKIVQVALSKPGTFMPLLPYKFQEIRSISYMQITKSRQLTLTYVK